jgi:hypothetical protein
MAPEAEAAEARLCTRCFGNLTDAGALYAAVRLTFRPQDARFMTLQTGDVMTKALMCRRCGLIEIIGDVNKLERLIGGG